MTSIQSDNMSCQEPYRAVWLYVTRENAEGRYPTVTELLFSDHLALSTVLDLHLLLNSGYVTLRLHADVGYEEIKTKEA